MNYELLAAELETAGIGVQGDDIFIHEMGSDVEQGLLIRGPLDGIPLMPDLPNYFKAEIQVIVRNPNQQAGEAISQQVMDLFTMARRELTGTSGTMSVTQMYPAKLPIRYPRSEGQLIEWSLNFCAFYVLGSK